MSTRNIVNSTLKRFHGYKMNGKWPKNIDQIVVHSSHRSMKKNLLSMGEKYPVFFHWYGTENLRYLFEK